MALLVVLVMQDWSLFGEVAIHTKLNLEADLSSVS